jgi:hypothetical protein
MVVVPWPNPIPGQPDQVVVGGMPLELVPGKYSVEEADRFGEKVSQGTLKYADFNPYESAHSIASLVGGAGLRRYSDAGDDPTQVATLYTESNNVNCCFAPAVLSPEVTYENLPGATGAAVWIGEDLRYQGGALVQRLLAVAPAGADTNVYQRQPAGPWLVQVTITGKGPPMPAGCACGIFAGHLVVGFGPAATAVVVWPDNTIHDLTQAASEPGGAIPIYVFAYTNDHAANYIVGGPSNAHYFRVMSSTASDSGYATPVSTGDSIINCIAPGGGLVLLYVGKVDELGMIDNQAVYHALIPFDSNLPTNCTPLRWVRATGADNARGSMLLVFSRERSLWEYSPSDQFSGTASVIAPWSTTFRRPPNARGIVRAIQGTSRWLYYAVENRSGNSWIYRNDQNTGAPHTYLNLGTTDVQYLTVSHLETVVDPIQGNPLLLFSAGTRIGTVVLPLDGDMELDDPNCRFQLNGYVDIPDIDLGFPDEDKIGFTVRVISDNLVGFSRYHDVQAGVDGGPLSDLGNVITSPGGEVSFPVPPKAKRIRLRIWFFTNDNTLSPQLWGLSLRVSLNTRVYRLFVFQTRLPAGSFATLADDLQNPYLQIKQAWSDRANGLPVSFADPWNDPYQVRIIKLQVQQALREADRSPEWVLDWTLLEFLPGTSSLVPTTIFVYDMDWTADISHNPDLQNLYGYDMPLAIYDAQ